MGSSRLPGKVLKKINDMPMIEIILKRLSLSRKVDNIILATSEKQQDILLSKFVKELGFEVFNGSENDVLSRYYWASKYYDLKNIIRITGDCPLVDPSIIDEMCNEFSRNNPDYLSNIFPKRVLILKSLVLNHWKEHSMKLKKVLIVSMSHLI
jgi:spore coat polysaccharide biosynthesis protein SpsF (cytidylyltransferase family)